MARRRKAHPVGIRVRSHFHAPWTGEVVASGRDHDWTARKAIWVTRDNKAVDRDYPKGPTHCLSHEGCVLVKVTHDRCGHPMRKPLWRVLDSYWLSSLDP